MATPALLALALGTLGVIAAVPEFPRVSLSAPDPRSKIPFNVTCSVHAAADVTVTDVTVTADNRSWPVTLGPDGRRATAAVTVSREGGVRLGCSARVAGAEIHGHATVQAYYLPVPLLEVPEAAVAGAVLRGRCSVPGGTGSDTQLLVRARGRELGRRRRPPVEFQVPVREEDAEPGLELLCVAEMAPFTPRNKSLRIRVLAEPRLDAGSCPPQQNWTEGQEGILRCRARGAPEPQVSCSKDGNSGNSKDGNSGNSGNSLPPGAPRRAHRAHAGTYLCRATNALGSAQSRVTLWVHYEDPVPLLPVLLGVLLPVLALLGLAGAVQLYRYRTRIGEYRLWKRQPPPGSRPLRPPPAAAPNGSATP